MVMECAFLNWVRFSKRTQFQGVCERFFVVLTLLYARVGTVLLPRRHEEHEGVMDSVRG